MTKSEQVEEEAPKPGPCERGHQAFAKWNGYEWLYADWCGWCGEPIPGLRGNAC